MQSNITLIDLYLELDTSGEKTTSCLLKTRRVFGSLGLCFWILGPFPWGVFVFTTTNHCYIQYMYM